MKIIAFLRGINVGGHHKVPMAELRDELIKLGCTDVQTLLNSGNVVFESKTIKMADLQNTIEAHLKKIFGFPVPTILRPATEINELILKQPFRSIQIEKDTRLYISFLKQAPPQKIDLPWMSADNSFQIIEIKNRTIFSVLDLSIAKTPKAMAELERLFGKDITTRNWNTIVKLTEL